MLPVVATKVSSMETVAVATAQPAVRLFVGGYAATIKGEQVAFGGDRCYSAVHPIRGHEAANGMLAQQNILLDSGAFSDSPKARLEADAALSRQLAWESRARQMGGDEATEWHIEALASYDLLIDETWVGGKDKIKRRWSLRDADKAVTVTVDAARFIASHRAQLAPRRLVMGAQGVDAIQYTDCARSVLAVCTADDWFGFGGWCILGRQQSLLPEFWRTIRMVVPAVYEAGVRHIHLFGVLWEPPVAGLLWLCDEYGLTLSTDSGRPILDCSATNHDRSGARCAYWRDNVAWWRECCANMRQSPFYCPPPFLAPARQLSLLEGIDDDMEAPASLAPHENDYQPAAWEQYSLGELCSFVDLFTKRARMRAPDAVGKIDKDLTDASNYLDIIEQNADAFIAGMRSRILSARRSLLDPEAANPTMGSTA